ncbi:MAG: alcohol dehydrogenase, partial [Thermoproteota archaeon]
KRIDASRIITHEFGLDEVQKAFGLAAKKKECLKVLIKGNLN